VLVWVSVWDSESQRDRFVQALEQSATGFPVPASIDPIDVSGTPGVRLRLGDAVDVEVSLSQPGG
jgi:hypothetical protein